MSRKVLVLATDTGRRMADACAPVVAGKDAAEVIGATLDLALATMEALGVTDEADQARMLEDVRDIRRKTPAAGTA